MCTRLRYPTTSRPLMVHLLWIWLFPPYGCKVALAPGALQSWFVPHPLRVTRRLCWSWQQCQIILLYSAVTSSLCCTFADKGIGDNASGPLRESCRPNSSTESNCIEATFCRTACRQLRTFSANPSTVPARRRARKAAVIGCSTHTCIADAAHPALGSQSAPNTHARHRKRRLLQKQRHHQKRDCSNHEARRPTRVPRTIAS